jgi:hypothetical protein
MLLSALQRFVALASCAAFGLAGCDQPLNAAECAELLDRYVTLLANSDRPQTTEMDLLRLRAEARERASRDPAFKQCPSAVSRTKLRCALAAPNVDVFEQCLL